MRVRRPFGFAAVSSGIRFAGLDTFPVVTAGRPSFPRLTASRANSEKRLQSPFGFARLPVLTRHRLSARRGRSLLLFVIVDRHIVNAMSMIAIIRGWPACVNGPLRLSPRRAGAPARANGANGAGGFSFYRDRPSASSSAFPTNCGWRSAYRRSAGRPRCPRRRCLPSFHSRPW